MKSSGRELFSANDVALGRCALNLRFDGLEDPIATENRSS